jgi:hypothetical protein
MKTTLSKLNGFVDFLTGSSFRESPYYKLLKNKDGELSAIKIFLPLLLPFIVIYSVSAVFYPVILHLPVQYYLIMSILSVWFYLGPYLVYCYFDKIINLKYKFIHNKSVYSYLENNNEKHFYFYRCAYSISSSLFILVCIPSILLNPTIIFDFLPLASIYNPVFICKN